MVSVLGVWFGFQIYLRKRKRACHSLLSSDTVSGIFFFAEVLQFWTTTSSDAMPEKMSSASVTLFTSEIGKLTRVLCVLSQNFLQKGYYTKEERNVLLSFA